MAGLTMLVEDSAARGLVPTIRAASRDWPQDKVDGFMAEWRALFQADRLVVAWHDRSVVTIDLSPELVDLLARYGVGEVTG